MSKKIDKILYEKVDFKWVGSHYDLHLNGTCYYNNEIHEFKTISGEWDDETDNWEDSYCEIYKLTLKEKLKWLYWQKKFEWLVGYHWTDDNRKKGVNFYYRRPKWLYKLLFKLHYLTN